MSLTLINEGVLPAGKGGGMPNFMAVTSVFNMSDWMIMNYFIHQYHVLWLTIQVHFQFLFCHPESSIFFNFQCGNFLFLRTRIA